MTDLRKAAEDLMPILERWKMTYPPCSGADWDKVEALRQALAQPEQEPVLDPDIDIAYDAIDRFLRNHLDDDDYEEFSNYLQKIYTAPPKRDWVGLTGLEQKELMAMNSRYAVFETEAKLKEKNT